MDRAGKVAESLSKHTDVFKNSGFEGWQFKMLTAARAISQKAHDVMEYPRSNLDTEVPDDAFTFDPEKKDLNQQLYYVLTEKTEGEAFDLVRGVPLQNGAEAWRRLLVRFDARTIGKEMLLARRVVNPPKIKNHRDTAAHIEKWQECGRKLEQEYGCKVEPGLQKAILIEMLPATLMEGVMARLDASQTFDDVKRLILNYVETRIDFGGVALMDVGNLDFYDQWNDHHHEERGEYENEEVYMMHYGGKAKGKGKGKQGFQGQCNHCGEWGHKAVQCQKRLTCWTCGELGHRSAECPKGKGKGKNDGKGQFEQSHTNKGRSDKGFNKGWGKQDNKGYGKGSFSKGKGPYGNGATYAVMEEQYWSQWDGHTEGEGEGALALFNLTDGPAGKEPTTLSRSSEPMRVDLRDFIKPKNVVTSKLNNKKEKVKMQKQNRFEILGCLLEDNEVNDGRERSEGHFVRNDAVGDFKDSDCLKVCED